MCRQEEQKKHIGDQMRSESERNCLLRRVMKKCAGRYRLFWRGRPLSPGLWASQSSWWLTHLYFWQPAQGWNRECPTRVCWIKVPLAQWRRKREERILTAWGWGVRRGTKERTSGKMSAALFGVLWYFFCYLHILQIQKKNYRVNFPTIMKVCHLLRKF